MAVAERLRHYNTLIGANGKRLADMYRFQSPPNDKFPQIYIEFDSLLNHKSRLVRSVKLWLGDLLTNEEIAETQMILVCHDVLELRDGDESRLSDREYVDRTDKLGQWLVLEDEDRYLDFLKAQNFAEKGAEKLPSNPLSLVARWMDTMDGNIIAYELMANYAVKTGGFFDPGLQGQVDRSIAYVNKMRSKYRTSLARLPNNKYQVEDLLKVLDRLQNIEVVRLTMLARRIESQGYVISGEIV